MACQSQEHRCGSGVGSPILGKQTRARLPIVPVARHAQLVAEGWAEAR